MSTRCTTHFTHGEHTVAIVYRHSDGYPEGAGLDIRQFLLDCAQLDDPRFDDPSYLAAKYVVWLADHFNTHYDSAARDFVKSENRLDFLSVGICQEDPCDIEYRYTIDCGERVAWGFQHGFTPKVSCLKIRYDGANTEVPVPELPTPKEVAQ
jgi:hypothetical protein